MPFDMARRLGGISLALILAAVIGCGRGESPGAAVDPDQAQATLRRALSAWQAGEAYGALAQGSPPVRVIDDDWLAGFRLESFELGAQVRNFGPTLQCPVTLRLRDRSGRPIRKLVNFEVATGPAPSVIRQD